MRLAFCVAVLLFLMGVNQLQCAEGLRPAVIGSGADSVAAKLHYPPKERDSKTEATVVFFCEVAANGRAKNIRTYWNKGYQDFGNAVEKALNQGHFTPAMVGGKSSTVLIGGTVFFLVRGDHPTVVLSMATADKQKAAAMQNYIQPQMIGSDADFRRKLLNALTRPSFSFTTRRPTRRSWLPSMQPAICSTPSWSAKAQRMAVGETPSSGP